MKFTQAMVDAMTTDTTTQVAGATSSALAVDYFEQNNSRLSDPAFDLKEFGINRWQWLPIDPQKNAVEPFRRLGENTVLETLDAHQTLCK